jgi:TPP-dependent pyruvate/acetoin dehydrogenase alpha subunit
MRPEGEIEKYRRQEPLPKLRALLNDSAAERIERAAEATVEQAVAWAKRQPFPDVSSLAIGAAGGVTDAASR